MTIEAENIKAIDNLNAAAKLLASAVAKLEERMAKDDFSPSGDLKGIYESLMMAVTSITPNGSPERKVADAMMADSSLPW